MHTMSTSHEMVKHTVAGRGEYVFSQHIFMWVVENHAMRGNDPVWEYENQGYEVWGTESTFDLCAMLAQNFSKAWVTAYKAALRLNLHHDPAIYASEWVGFYEWTPRNADVDAMLKAFPFA